MHYAENAILTKARAMFARRLTPEQYEDMLACRTLAELAGYLKEKTAYGVRMQDLNPAFIHRDLLEDRLREAQYRQFESISYYEYAINAGFYKYFVVQSESNRLLATLAQVAAGRPCEDPAAFSAFFRKHEEVDWQAVSRATTPAQWLEALKDSPYYEPCRPFVDDTSGSVNMQALDTALQRYKMEHLLHLADAAYNNASEKALMDFLRMQVDMANVVNIYRAGLLRRQGVALANSAVITGGGRLSDRQLQQLIAAPDDRAFETALNTTVCKGMANLQRDGYIERSVDRYWYEICRHELRFTVFPSVALMAYVGLQELELRNVIHIIEGIRYNAGASAREILVGAEPEQTIRDVR